MSRELTAQSEVAPGTLAFLLRSYFPALAEPRTDLLDLAAVAMGWREVACLSMDPEALEEPSFRRLVAVAMACGVAVADLNGNLGLAAEYRAGRATCQVAVWLACRTPEGLSELVEAHARLQPRGFTAWASFLGRQLGYPACCVESYTAAVRSAEEREEFWQLRGARAHGRGELLIGFAPCDECCPAGQEVTIGRLAVARRLGLLEEEAARAWLLRLGRADAWRALRAMEPAVDLAASFAPFRIPVAPL